MVRIFCFFISITLSIAVGAVNRCISYNLGGPGGSQISMSCHEVGSIVENPGLIPPPGYTYKYSVEFPFVMPDEYMTVYVYQETLQTVYLLLRIDGESSVQRLQCYTGEPIELTNNLIREGYYLDGLPEVGPVSSTIVECRYVPIEYKIEYNLSGGVNCDDNPVSYTVESEDIVFCDPSKYNFDFVEWSEGSVGGGKILSIPSGSTGDVVVYAKWTESANVKLESASNVQITAEDGRLKVSGTDSEVLVFSLVGRLIYKGYDKDISLPSTGLYVVLIDGKVYKVVAR